MFFSNYIPSKLITIDDKDPPWMSDEIPNKINKRDIFYQLLKKYKLNLTDFDVINELTLELSSRISQRGEEYYFQLAKKLNDPQTSLSFLKKIFHGRKIPVIPPLLTDGKLVSDFKEKVNIFKEFFSHQCTLFNNGSECPNQLILYSNKRLSSVIFDDQDIFKSSIALNINKAHGYDDISIRMIKICDSALVKP